MADITTIGKRELSSAQIGDYVHKAAEIERDIYALQEAEKRFRKDAKEMKEEAEDLREEAMWNREYDEQPDKLRYVQLVQQKPQKEKIKFSKVIFSGLLKGALFAILGFLPVLVIAATVIDIFFILTQPEFYFQEELYSQMVEQIMGKQVPVVVAIICFAIGIFTFIVTSIKAPKKAEKRYQEALKKYNTDKQKIEVENKKRKEQYEKECKEAEERKRYYFQEARQKESQAMLNDQKASMMTRQADIMRDQRKKLERLRSEFYSVGIIPPDYREMDCVYVFDQIFRNDLADNMRQAVSIYEERVFRGEVIRGMGAIVQQLSSIKGQLAGLARDIYSIQTNVDFMSQDLYKLVDGQKAHQKTVDSILRESKAQTEKYDEILENSKATRYATEAVQRSVEYNNKYKNI